MAVLYMYMLLFFYKGELRKDPAHLHLDGTTTLGGYWDSP